MEAIASWANVEQFMLNAYISLLGGAREDAATIYLALETQSAKVAAINAVARKKLTKEHNALLAAILKLAKANQKQRDRLAHWVWGNSPNLPDALLLADPRVMAVRFPTHDDIQVYTSQDFNDLIAGNDRVCGHGFFFNWMISGQGPQSPEELYQRLCAEPEIRDILERQV